LQAGTLVGAIEKGPHQLIPAGLDLTSYEIGAIFAYYHYDFNFLTAHTRGRFSGFLAWDRQGRRMTIDVPPNCIALQVGKMLEQLTGGLMLAGFHELVYTEAVGEEVAHAVQVASSLRRVTVDLFVYLNPSI
jgi:hypothetical protein